MRSPRSGVERYLPLVYMLTALALIVLLLPSALRPPQPPPPTSSEFSPDAPPDEDQEILLTERAQGRSRTAGTAGVVEGGPVDEEPVAAVQVPRKGRCFGDPPRQTDSTYSPPCAPAFVGSNGGTTARGVTATEIRVAVLGDAEDVGPVPAKEGENESAALRTYRVWQTYFNEKFELYGRALRFYIVSGDSEASGSARAAVQKADEEFKVFAVQHNGGDGEDETIRRKLLAYGGGNQAPERFVESAPYMWAWLPPANLLRDRLVNLVCAQMAHKPVSERFTTDPTMVGKPRVYGVIAYNDATHYGAGEYFDKRLREECGEHVSQVVKLNLGDQSGEASTAMAKMRSAGVTTILLANDGITTAAITQSATGQSYFPEWFSEGSGGNDLNALARAYDPVQWKKMIGITALEMPAPVWQRDHFRAYKEVDPDRDPEGTSDFYEILQMVGGFQQTGPALTVPNFQHGMFTRWPVRPDEHLWAVWGGYKQGNWAFPYYVKLEYWDADADDQGSDLRGAYRYLYRGKGFKEGEFPADSPWHCHTSPDPKPDESGCCTVTWISRDGETKSW